jgi:hypothetical protein
MPLFIADAQTLVLNVKDFGAAGLGSSTSAKDTAAIQAAINSLPATGGIIYVPTGSYTLNASLTVPATILTGFKFYGAGWSSILTIANGVNDYALKFLESSSGINGAEVGYMKIDCNGTNQTGGGGIDAFGATCCYFDYLWLHTPYNEGIHIHGGTLIGNFGIQSYVTNCLFDNGSSVAGNGRGLSLDSTDQITIIGNVFREMGGTSGSDAVCIRDTNGSNTIMGNIFGNNNGAHVGGGGIKTYASYNRIVGNQFDSLAGTNVALLAFGNIVTDNNFLNVGKSATSQNSASGVYTNTNRQTINDNYFSSDGTASNGTESFIFFDSNTTAGTAQGNIYDTNNGGSGFPIMKFGTGTSNKIAYNSGWVTEKNGTASITTGNTSIAVSHGLSVTPTLQQIMVTPQTSLGSASQFWVTNPTTTQFTINVNTNPAQTVTFGWSANASY